MKGTITRDYTVWCGTCENWHQDGSVNSAIDMKLEIKRRGWRESETHGWRCPACLKRR